MTLKTTSNMENNNEIYKYWFENPEFDEHDQFGEKYYVNNFYTDIVFNLDIPENGYIVVMGTARCKSFDLLCKRYGSNRCIGFDLFNPTNHPNVVLKDCNNLSDYDNIPIAFAHNDIGNMSQTPDLKIKTQKWLIKNIVKNGILLGNNNLNRKKFKFEELMTQNGFENKKFSQLPTELTKNLPKERIEGYMLSIKK